MPEVGFYPYGGCWVVSPDRIICKKRCAISRPLFFNHVKILKYKDNLLVFLYECAPLISK